MSSQIKCPKCQTWNTNQDYCTACNTLLNYTIERENAHQKSVDEFNNRPQNPWLEKCKNSANPLLRAVYYVAYSSWLLFLIVTTLSLTVLVFGPG